MDEDLRELYQEIILDHNRNPHNYHVIENASCQAEGYNPLCGDHYSVFATIEDNVIKDISFQGSGCAISKSSASIMTDTIKGEKVEDAQELLSQFITTVKDPNDQSEFSGKLEKAMVLRGVHEFPTRIKCATLAWHAIQNALAGESKASTE